MTTKLMILFPIGILLLLLGLLWALQGAGVIHVRPILCFVNCQPITGKSTPWLITGSATFIVGVLVLIASARRKSPRKTA